MRALFTTIIKHVIFSNVYHFSGGRGNENPLDMRITCISGVLATAHFLL